MQPGSSIGPRGTLHGDRCHKGPANNTTTVASLNSACQERYKPVTQHYLIMGRTCPHHRLPALSSACCPLVRSLCSSDGRGRGDQSIGGFLCTTPLLARRRGAIGCTGRQDQPSWAIDNMSPPRVPHPSSLDGPHNVLAPLDSTWRCGCFSVLGLCPGSVLRCLTRTYTRLMMLPVGIQQCAWPATLSAALQLPSPFLELTALFTGWLP
jgi:hypothetical protein